MKIYSMTATFGKLEHQTLKLDAGLNIIQAPNEWGKSTWCAFLVAMLYGIDTKAKSTKTQLADKERYAPWSGSPMAGRIDLNWNGRDITIERTTKGRLIMGQFQAYETATGIEIPELTALNCGQMLLGVERSVFTRAGFLKLSDLPVTQDDSLRRRLNNLVTTGDESGAGDKLGQTLKDLKNKCRYNRSGLLPQAESQRDLLERHLAELEDLRTQSQNLQARQTELEIRTALLENHRAALNYDAAKADAQRVREAEEAHKALEERYGALSSGCSTLPARVDAEQYLRQGQALEQQLQNLQLEEGMLPPAPQEPDYPAHLKDILPQDAIAQATADKELVAKLDAGKKKHNPLLWIPGILLLIATIAMVVLQMPSATIALVGTVVCIATAILVTALISSKNKRLAKERDGIFAKYPSPDPDTWIREAQDYAAARQQYSEELTRHQVLSCNFTARLDAVRKDADAYTGGAPLSDTLRKWTAVLAAWDALGDAQRDLQRSTAHLETLKAMVKDVQPPAREDTLTFTEGETTAQLNACAYELRQLQLKLGQYQGRMEALGREQDLLEQLRIVKNRIHTLEEYYVAIELAQKALDAASTELQRRFAPRIAKRAQELFSRLTGSRYDRLRLEQDLSIQAGAQGEDTLRSAQWRSDGTTDQLYLALRLAVAEELTPNAPLILDDALVRFDEDRLRAALRILREAADHKQVILFTCQDREAKI